MGAFPSKSRFAFRGRKHIKYIAFVLFSKSNNSSTCCLFCFIYRHVGPSLSFSLSRLFDRIVLQVFVFFMSFQRVFVNVCDVDSFRAATLSPRGVVSHSCFVLTIVSFSRLFTSFQFVCTNFIILV